MTKHEADVVVQLIAESVIAVGLLFLSAASVMAVKDFSPTVIVAVVGANLTAWGVLLLNSNLWGAEE